MQRNSGTCRTAVPTHPTHGRPAFTIVELLVSIAIIGVLFALLMPAVQQAREAARKTSCRNNLKQIGLATLNFHDVKNAFPPGQIMLRPGDPPELSCGQDSPTWLVRILPFLEQENFYEQWNFLEPFSAHTPEVRGKALSVYVCPSRRSVDSAVSPQRTVTFTAPCGCSGPQLFESGATGDYAGNMGDLSPGAYGFTSDFYWGGQGTGVIISSRALCINGQPRDWIDKIRHRDITDGTTNTLLVGEMHINKLGLNEPPENGPIYNGWHFSFSTRIGGPGVPLAAGPDYVDTRYYSFGSWHSGICNFSFCDGSVRSISNSIDTDVLGRLCRRDDGQVVGEF